MQAVAKAKDQIKKFRRRESSMSQGQSQVREADARQVVFDDYLTGNVGQEEAQNVGNSM